ncbi:hypothetical protein HYT51_01075 [Candidatus Woesearchaeota archaeon]|nr:hypothetical protein [Candidatus Woesearchaeota archaeon]
MIKKVKALIQNKENINLKFFIQVTGDKGAYSYYDNSLLEAKSTKYLTINFNQEKTGSFIKQITITPYIQLEKSKIIYKFSSSSLQINKQIQEELRTQESIQQDSQILTMPQPRESTYIYGNGLIASLDDQGRIQYYHKDNLGSIRAITDNTGDIIYTASYEPFGNTFAETGSSFYTYTGKQLDNTGLYYYGARYYDSNLGRFTQIDPVLSAEDSPYVYVKNNPLKYTDPSGMRGEEAAPSACKEGTAPLWCGSMRVKTEDEESQKAQVFSQSTPQIQEEKAKEDEPENKLLKSIDDIGEEYLEEIYETIFSTLQNPKYTYRTKEAIIREVQKKYPQLDTSLIVQEIVFLSDAGRIDVYLNTRSGEFYYRDPHHRADPKEMSVSRVEKIFEFLFPFTKPWIDRDRWIDRNEKKKPIFQKLPPRYGE